jgi:hypothetical protein
VHRLRELLKLKIGPERELSEAHGETDKHRLGRMNELRKQINR